MVLSKVMKGVYGEITQASYVQEKVSVSVDHTCTCDKNWGEILLYQSGGRCLIWKPAELAKVPVDALL